MIELRFWRSRPATAEPLRLPTGLALAALRAAFTERRRVMLEGILPSDSADSIVRAASKRSLALRAPSPQALSTGTPSYMFYEESVRPHRNCNGHCAPICRIADALTQGVLRDFAQAVAGRLGLRTTGTYLRAYVKGSHVDRDVATESGVEVTCCLTVWDPAFGAQFRFGDEEAQTLPFGALHLREIRPGDTSAVTLVTDHGPLVVLSASMRDG
jgi:hypothetical protein